MNELFEYLHSKKLGRYNIVQQKFVEKFISTTTEEEFYNLINDINLIVVKNEDITPSNFNFTCNNELSGEVFKCSCLECRLKSIDSLAKFSILYSDAVIITSPFYKYLIHFKYDQNVLAKFADDISILYHMQPLLSEGLIKFSSGMICVCSDCNNTLEAARSSYHSSVDKVLEPIKNNLLKLTKVKFTLEYGTPEFEITFPEEFDEDRKQFLVINNTEYLRELSKLFNTSRNHELSKSEINKLRLLDEVYLEKVFKDIVDQRWNGRFYNTKYVTSRKVDLQILSSLNDKKNDIHSKALIDGLTHEVPFIHNVSMDALMDLRRNEFDSFQIYRQALKKVVDNSAGLDSSKIKEAFDDIAKKELLKMDLVVSKNKKNLAKNSLRELVIGSAVVTGGLFTHVISPEIGAAISMLGGAKYLHQFATKTAQIIDEPIELSKNDMYFLWKVKELVRKK